MFIEAIKKELKNRNWSILELSRQTNMRYPSLTEYIRGNKDLTGRNVEKIFETLNINLAENDTTK